MNEEIIIADLPDGPVTIYGKAVVNGQELYMSVSYGKIKGLDNEGLRKLGMKTLTNTFNRMSSNVQNIQMITITEYLENTEE